MLVKHNDREVETAPWSLAVVHKHPMRAGEALSCVMITGCSSHSHRQHDRQVEVDFEGWNVGKSAVSRQLRWAYWLALHWPQSKAETDTDYDALLYCSLSTGRSIANAEAPPCGSYTWGEKFHTGAFYSITGFKPTEPGVATYQYKWSTERVRCV